MRFDSALPSKPKLQDMEQLIQDVYDMSNALGLEVIPTPEELQA